MDLSKLKWPIVIAVVLGLGWLMTSPGIDYLHRKFTRDPGDDLNKAEMNEAGLSRLGGFLLMTFRYEKAQAVLEDALDLYPDGKNYYFNYFRLARVKENLGDYQAACDILKDLMDSKAHYNFDQRVPNNDVLSLRRNRLLETHELGVIGM